MLIKILVMLEGTSQQLNPDFSLAELLNDYKSQAIRRRFSPKRTIRRLRSEVRAWTELVERFPRDAGEILDRVKLPPDEDIPGTETKDPPLDELLRWRLPGTRITITRVEEVLAKAFCTMVIMMSPGTRNAAKSTPAISRPLPPSASVKIARNSSEVTIGASRVCV